MKNALMFMEIASSMALGAAGTYLLMNKNSKSKRSKTKNVKQS